MNGPYVISGNRKRKNKDSEDTLICELCRKVIGQEHVMRTIAPYVRMYGAGLAPEGRPAGVFLLLGPTGTGKTRTVEALAEVLHGSRKNLLRVDCGEYQMDHEVAKLIGAPPGYLGHRETQPVLSQAKLASVTSSHSSLSIVLFDEVEKAAPSLTRLLLGVLDKASLRLGDNNVVNFERSLVFLTSNVGARGIQRILSGGIGFNRQQANLEDYSGQKLDQIALQAARRDFSPEFLNRVDAALTYHPLKQDALIHILDLHIEELQQHIERRLGTRAFKLNVTKRGREFLLERGTSAEYGAREIRRAVQKYVAHPVSLLVSRERIRPGSTVKIDMPEIDGGLTARAA